MDCTSSFDSLLARGLDTLASMNMITDSQIGTKDHPQELSAAITTVLLQR